MTTAVDDNDGPKEIHYADLVPGYD